MGVSVLPTPMKINNPYRYDFSNHGMNQTTRLRPHPLNAEIHSHLAEKLAVTA